MTERVAQTPAADVHRGDLAVPGSEEPIGFSIPTDCEVLDRPSGTLLPGLIDAHLHLVADSGWGALDRLPEFSDDDLARTIEESLRIQLATGVTTVRDLGDMGWSVTSRS